MIIENVQKTVLLDEAAKKGLSRFALYSIPQSFTKMLGDYTDQEYGFPLTKPYMAVAGDTIDVTLLSQYLVNISRDIRVGNQAKDQIRSKLENVKNEFWVRSQNLKNKANYLQHTAALEGFKSESKAVWVFGDTFNDTNKIDMTLSNIWVDSSEGIAYLPTAMTNTSLKAENITVESFQWATASNNLGSSPNMALDGLESTNWRSLFVQGGDQTNAVFKFDKPYDVSNIQIDPTGFGMNIVIEYDTGKGFQIAINEIIYKTTTYIIGQSAVQRLRISFSPANAVLPKSVGISNIRIFTDTTTDSGILITNAVDVPVAFSEMLVDYTANIPAGASIQSYVSFDNAVTWKELKSGSWTPIIANNTYVVKLDKTSMVEEGGLFAIPVDNGPLTPTEGVMVIGKNQIELDSFKKDYTALGEIPHLPQANEFNDSNNKKFRTWLTVPTYNERPQADRVYLKPTGTQTTSIVRGTNVYPFQYKVTDQAFADMGMLMMYGSDSQRICQYNTSYKISFFVYVENDYFVDYSKYFFFQGYRNRANRSFGETGRNYGSFSMAINGVNIVASSKPETIFTTADSDGSFLETGNDGVGVNGNVFSFTLKKGWNLVEICTHTIDPEVYGTDTGTGTLDPLLFLSLYPSFFDLSFQRLAGISKIVASGEANPVSEFELLWNIPQDFNYWAWSTTSSKVLFNVFDTVPIDGYLKGSGPIYEIEYKSTPDSTPSISSARFKFAFNKSATVKTGPILDEYKVSVR